MSTNASNCRQIRDRLSSYLDGELGDELRVDVDAHLEMCLSCRQQLQDLKELDDACRMTLGPASLVGKSRAAAAARLAERIESASWGGRDEHAHIGNISEHVLHPMSVGALHPAMDGDDSVVAHH